MQIVALFLWCLSAVMVMLGVRADGGGGHHKVIFKIPVIYHTNKHTHTKYVTIKHGGGGGGHDGHSHGGHGEFLHWN